MLQTALNLASSDVVGLLSCRSCFTIALIGRRSVWPLCFSCLAVALVLKSARHCCLHCGLHCCLHCCIYCPHGTNAGCCCACHAWPLCLSLRALVLVVFIAVFVALMARIPVAVALVIFGRRCGLSCCLGCCLSCCLYCPDGTNAGLAVALDVRRWHTRETSKVPSGLILKLSCFADSQCFPQGDVYRATTVARCVSVLGKATKRATRYIALASKCCCTV